MSGYDPTQPRRQGKFDHKHQAAPPKDLFLQPEDEAVDVVAPEVETPAPGELLAMLERDEPVSNRRVAAMHSFVYEELGPVAAQDPDPIVRANALYAFRLPESDRERLQTDPQVRQVLDVILR